MQTFSNCNHKVFFAITSFQLRNANKHFPITITIIFLQLPHSSCLYHPFPWCCHYSPVEWARRIHSHLKNRKKKHEVVINQSISIARKLENCRGYRLNSHCTGCAIYPSHYISTNYLLAYMNSYIAKIVLITVSVRRIIFKLQKIVIINQTPEKNLFLYLLCLIWYINNS